MARFPLTFIPPGIAVAQASVMVDAHKLYERAAALGMVETVAKLFAAPIETRPRGRQRGSHSAALQKRRFELMLAYDQIKAADSHGEKSDKEIAAQLFREGGRRFGTSAHEIASRIAQFKTNQRTLLEQVLAKGRRGRPRNLSKTRI